MGVGVEEEEGTGGSQSLLGLGGSLDVSWAGSHFAGLWQPGLGVRSRFVQMVPGFLGSQKMTVGALDSPQNTREGGRVG